MTHRTTNSKYFDLVTDFLKSHIDVPCGRLNKSAFSVEKCLFLADMAEQLTSSVLSNNYKNVEVFHGLLLNL